MNSAGLPPTGSAVAEQFAAWATALEIKTIPSLVREKASQSLLDVTGLCLAARKLDYVQAVLRACENGGITAIGHSQGLDMAGAALVNGTAAHGEDYDDTLEGTPVHPGAVIIPAVLVAGEGHDRSGEDVLAGIAVGTELLCRLAVVAPTAVHRAGFHPTAVLGTFAAAVAVARTLSLGLSETVNALGIAGSMTSGIIEYLAEGTSTKRLHTGWAAQSGLKAAILGKNGFDGPRTVFEGQHGFFFSFADHSISPNFGHVTDGLGETWKMQGLAFKPYACGTMCQPFVDCAIRLLERGIDIDQIAGILCKVGEGTVHRLWEPLVEKQRPTTRYSAKFSVPYCIAAALVDTAAGIEQFSDVRIADPRILDLAAKISYEVDPENEYPTNYSGHLRVTMADGRVHEAGQPHLRGGVHEPLLAEELGAKYRANAAAGNISEELADELKARCETAFEAPDMAWLAQFRL